MHLTAAWLLASDAMYKAGLGADWKLDFRSSRYVAGSCSYTFQTITLSKELMFLWEEDEVLDTILHEIAHALVGPGVQAHGAEWKAMAREIGASDQRCYGEVLPEAELDRARAATASWSSRRPFDSDWAREGHAVAASAPTARRPRLDPEDYDNVRPACACHGIETVATGECAFA